MLGLSIEGPGNRTAEPVPDEITRYPALLDRSPDVQEEEPRNGISLTTRHDGLPLSDSWRENRSQFATRLKNRLG